MSNSRVLAILLAAALPAMAIDHSNLDEGRPLRIEDPYPLAHGEFALEAGLGATFERKAVNRGLAQVELLYGALPNLQLEVGSTFSSNPNEVEEPERSGDLRVAALYNFNQESTSIPALGLKAEVDLPSGEESVGTDVELKALVTKSFGNVSLHFNGGYTFIHGEEDGERQGQYELVLGASVPIGAPAHTRTTLIVDLYTEQSLERGEKPVYGVEGGVRYQLSSQSVIDAGAGSEAVGPTERSAFYFTVGFSYSF